MPVFPACTAAGAFETSFVLHGEGVERGAFCWWRKGVLETEFASGDLERLDPHVCPRRSPAPTTTTTTCAPSVPPVVVLVIPTAAV